MLDHFGGVDDVAVVGVHFEFVVVVVQVLEVVVVVVASSVELTLT